ncbi:MAG: type III-A CRISPR-associated RAMP protein Csm3 [Bacteroidota bacterium]|nr:type III-A CRISPR-associated RAMP protein Csm3 [Bacteroidota bacterium]
MNEQVKLNEKILVEGWITAVSGLHIGGSNVGASIGGADATVVRNPLTSEPYIPGSSLKGKMRCLVERMDGKFGGAMGKYIKVGPYLEISNNCLIPKLFGTLPEKMKENERQPTSRLIVRDAPLTEDSAEELRNSGNTDMPYTEVKTEVVIDRITSQAMPRQLERVPAGSRFIMRMIVNVYEGDVREELLDLLFRSMILLQNDYLGGKGTRGSGEIKITVNRVRKKTREHYVSRKDWEDDETLMQRIPAELKHTE